jgi:NAD-dependent SIR2 family protein deacetylase
MSEIVKFRCLNCGERFSTEAMTREEQKEAEDRFESYSPIQCPKCKRTEIRRGWD